MVGVATLIYMVVSIIKWPRGKLPERTNQMTPELIAMLLGGGLSGFVMKLIGAQMEHQARAFDRMLQNKEWRMIVQIVRLLVGAYGFVVAS
jgi:hypothetical protein